LYKKPVEYGISRMMASSLAMSGLLEPVMYIPKWEGPEAEVDSLVFFQPLMCSSTGMDVGHRAWALILAGICSWVMYLAVKGSTPSGT
jgi:hypothetical protein